MKKPKFNRKYFAFPYLALSIIFVIVPLVILFWYSLTDMYGKFTFDNYVRFFTNQGGDVNVLLRSLWVAFLTTLGCFVLAYPLAYILAHKKLRMSAVIVLFFVLPIWINFMLRTYALKVLLGLFTDDPRGMTYVVIGLIYDFFPFMLLPLYTVLSNIDQSYIEASNDLGGNSVNTFLKVTLPLSIPGIVSGCIMVFMPTVSTFAINAFFGDTSTWLFGDTISYDYGRGETGWHSGAALAFVMLIIVAASVALTRKFSGSTKFDGKAGGTAV